MDDVGGILQIGESLPCVLNEKMKLTSCSCVDFVDLHVLALVLVLVLGPVAGAGTVAGADVDVDLLVAVR